MARNATPVDMAPVIREPGIPPTPENTPAPAFDDPTEAPAPEPEAVTKVEPAPKKD